MLIHKNGFFKIYYWLNTHFAHKPNTIFGVENDVFLERQTISTFLFFSFFKVRLSLRNLIYANGLSLSNLSSCSDLGRL